MSLRVLTALLTLSILSALPVTAQIRILAYGDSNTWGWKPVVDGNPIPRYSDAERWPGVMQRSLGSAFKVEINGLVGRTLDADLSEGIGQLNGVDHNGNRRLGLALTESAPINLVVVMLGTNDLIEDLNRSPDDIAKGLSRLADIVKAGVSPHTQVKKSSQLLVVVPPRLTDTSRTPFKDLFGRQAIEKSRLLHAAFQREAIALGLTVFDANVVVKIDTIDGLHLSRAGHQQLGRAIAMQVLKLTSQ
jgi:lysophospholipase L1-like esterase